MKIYLDSLREHSTDSNLYENTIYYLDFETATPEQIKEEISRARLIEFIKWQNGNRYATLKVTNYIGNLYFFEKIFDIKSPKFLLHLSGKEQFKHILSELESRSKNLTFSNHSPSISTRQTDFSDFNPDVLMQFSYFKQIILDWPKNVNLNSDLEKIFKKNNFKYQTTYEDIDVKKVKRISNKTIQELMSRQKNLTIIESDSLLSSLPISEFLSQNSDINYFPLKLKVKKSLISIDTSENRFIKFFFEYIQNIANRLTNIKGLPQTILSEQKKVLSFCRQVLSNPFFKEIGLMSSVPKNSTVLYSQPGYKEIFEHYTKSRFGVKNILNEFKQESLSQELKKISDLYEYWVFFVIAEAFLGSDFIVEKQETIIKSGNISYGVCFKKDNISVYYNKTESSKRKSSYSLSFRPDTTVEIRIGERNIKLIFDAKYKVQHAKNTDPEDQENEILKYVKVEDIYKMHTYLEAISDVQFAMVVYPGTKFYFYEKNSFLFAKETIEDIEKFYGVGAIPLIPTDSNSKLLLQRFVDKIKTSILPDKDNTSFTQLS